MKKILSYSQPWDLGLNSLILLNFSFPISKIRTMTAPTTKECFEDDLMKPESIIIFSQKGRKEHNSGGDEEGLSLQEPCKKASWPPVCSCSSPSALPAAGNIRQMHHFLLHTRYTFWLFLLVLAKRTEFNPQSSWIYFRNR